MEKFSRNYFLKVQTSNPINLVTVPPRPPTYLEIQPPFTVEFDLNRHSLGSVNSGSIRIYNLSQKTRNLIAKNWNDFGDFRTVVFQAGYGDTENLPTLFYGNLSQCQSVREGNNFITTLEMFDGGYAFSTATSDRTYKSGTLVRKVILDLINDLSPYGVSLGAVGAINNDNGTPKTLGKDTAYSGNTVNLLMELTSFKLFIDQTKANVLSDNETLPTPNLTVVNSDTGLLGTPTREQTYLNFDVLFEPSLYVGQEILLQSNTNSVYNNKHKIVSLRNRGMISPTVCGEAVTSIGVFVSKNLTQVTG